MEGRHWSTEQRWCCKGAGKRHSNGEGVGPDQGFFKAGEDSTVLCRSYGFPGSSDGKESTCNVGDLGSIPGSGRSPGGGHGNPLQYSCLENPHGQRSLAGYSPWGHTQSDMSERPSTQRMPKLIEKITREGNSTTKEGREMCWARSLSEQEGAECTAQGEGKARGHIRSDPEHHLECRLLGKPTWWWASQLGGGQERVLFHWLLFINEI